MGYVLAYNERWGNFAVRRFVDKIAPVGLENLEGLRCDRPYVYVGNHQTTGDLFCPYRVILNNRLPMPRTVAKESLRKVKPIFDFEKFGVIWIDRGAKKASYLEGLTSLIAQGFRETESSWFFLEATRSQTANRVPAEFKTGACGIILNAAEMAYWMFWKRNRGTVHIAFSRSYELDELTGDGSKSVRRRQFAKNTHDIVSEMWRGLELM